MATEDEKQPAQTDSRASALIGRFAERINNQVVAIGGWPPLSEEAKSIISKRTWPGVAAKRDTVSLGLDFLAMDIQDLSNRIRQYTYIDQYRLLDDAAYELKISFVAQMLRLQRYELYTIQEMASDIIEYLEVLAANLSMCAGAQAHKFSRKFKERFEYELRDRHRMVHRHERPRLATRMLDTLGATSDREEAKLVVAELVKKFEALFKSDNGFLAEAVAEARQRMNLTSQANDIWTLFEEHALAVLKDVGSGDAPPAPEQGNER